LESYDPFYGANENRLTARRSNPGFPVDAPHQGSVRQYRHYASAALPLHPLTSMLSGRFTGLKFPPDISCYRKHDHFFHDYLQIVMHAVKHDIT
jgi:hypothetical protein